jgi:transposase
MRSTKIVLTPEDRQRLERVVRAPLTPQKHVWRARIVLLSAAGLGTMAIARQSGKSTRAVWRWQDRFAAEGVAGVLLDKTRPGRLPPLSPEQGRTVVEKTLHETPAAATHWSTRTMARAVGVGKTSILKIWREHGLKPHLVKGFTVSRVIGTKVRAAGV